MEAAILGTLLIPEPFPRSQDSIFLFELFEHLGIPALGLEHVTEQEVEVWPATSLQIVYGPRCSKSSNRNIESWDLGNRSGISSVPKIGYSILGTISVSLDLHEASRVRDIKWNTRGQA